MSNIGTGYKNGWFGSEGGVKESTWANYSVAVMNHILPALGEYTLEELTEEKLQETVLFWLRQGRLDGSGGLSGKTVKDLANVVKAACAQRRYYHLPRRIFPCAAPARHCRAWMF